MIVSFHLTWASLLILGYFAGAIVQGIGTWRELGGSPVAHQMPIRDHLLTCALIGAMWPFLALCSVFDWITGVEDDE